MNFVGNFITIDNQTLPLILVHMGEIQTAS